jgi:diacylglycerol kinase family enzyme
VVAVVGLIGHPLDLPLVLILLILAVIAACVAVVRRGVQRIIALIVAALALAAMFVLPDLGAYLVLALVGGLTLVAFALGRLALGHDLARAIRGTKVGPARNAVLLMNPRSGGGKVAEFDLETKARERGITPVMLNPGDDLAALAEDAAATADVIGMAGGDGSQALVADVARRHGVPFVCVPAGTRNHFALDLGLDRDDVAAALDAFGDALERRVDLAMLGDRVFVNNASLGVYATVVQSPGYRDAKVTTVAQRLPELLGPDSKPFDLRFAPPDGATPTRTDILLVSNGAYRLDTLDGFGSRSRMDAGVLGIVAVAVDRAVDVPALISAQLTGRLARFRGYRSWKAPDFVVDSGQALLDVGVDGEALRLPPPLRFRCLPGALRVRVPRHAHTAAPAAIAPHGLPDAIAGLWQVLIGRPATRR